MGYTMTVQHPSASTKLYVGIDAGSVSLNGMVIDEKKQILYESPYVRHMGKVKENVIALI
jgi:activator of 2-hydroxyglutaryl-CoA dehydratase